MGTGVGGKQINEIEQKRGKMHKVMLEFDIKRTAITNGWNGWTGQ